MHFIDFLLQLLCFICWTLKNLYIFSFEYVIPVTGYVLPILIKYLSQLFTLVLRTFFTYIAPCIIQIVKGTTYIFTHILNGINFIFMSIVESDLNLEYAHAIAMISILVAIIYFHVTQRMFSFVHGIYEMIMLYVRFVINILKVGLFVVRYIYGKITVLFHRRINQERKVIRTRNHKSNRKHSINGSTHKIKENNNHSNWNNKNEL